MHLLVRKPPAKPGEMASLAQTQKMFSEVPTEIKSLRADTGNTEGENSTTGCNKGN